MATLILIIDVRLPVNFVDARIPRFPVSTSRQFTTFNRIVALNRLIQQTASQFSFSAADLRLVL